MSHNSKRQFNSEDSQIESLQPTPLNDLGSHWAVDRRSLLKMATIAGIGGSPWLTRLGSRLAHANRMAQKNGATRGAKPKSVIVLWLEGGPSQLETFDPHPGTKFSGETRAIKTRTPGVSIGSDLGNVAEQMDSIALVRSVTSKEADHERAIYNVKTGYRPDPTLIHPSLGSVICKETENDGSKMIDIPRHVSILPGNSPPRGGFLGDRYDAFMLNDPKDPVPDVTRTVDKDRFDRRLDDLKKIVSPAFARGRIIQNEGDQSIDAQLTKDAVRMMTAEQLSAFKVLAEPKSLRDQFGDTPFGRGCLTAIRLIEVGVRCVEVRLGGWDSHVNNHNIQKGRIEILDPAYAALLAELKKRELLDDTIVVCMGEFGRDPKINPAGGRDHWPHGFSIGLSGGGFVGGRVHGETAANPKLDRENPLQDVKEPYPIEDIHASIHHGLGIDSTLEYNTPIGRPMAISQGKPIRGLF